MQSGEQRGEGSVEGIIDHSYVNKDWRKERTIDSNFASFLLAAAETKEEAKYHVKVALQVQQVIRT